MSLPQQLNAIFRLSLYYSVIMVLLTRRASHLTVALATAAVTALVHEVSVRKEGFGPAAASECVAPTAGNPYMNVSIVDLMDRPGRPAACDPLSPAVKMQIADASKDALPSDGPYEKGRADRTWYTMPCTQSASKQGEYAQWLYGGDRTDKTAARPLDDQLK